jgi:zinc transporter ZupT
MLGDSILHLLPVVFNDKKKQTLNAFMVLFGFLFCLFFEVYLKIQIESNKKKEKKNEPTIKAFGYLNLLSDGIHNFIDGVGIAGSFLVGTRLGIANTIAIIFHEIPQEFSDFGVLLSAGFSYSFVIISNLLCGCLCILGCIFGLFFGSNIKDSETIIIAITAGSFIYISCVDMLPEVIEEITKKKSFLLSSFGISIGIGLMYLLEIVEPQITELLKSFI